MFWQGTHGRVQFAIALHMNEAAELAVQVLTQRLATLRYDFDLTG